jgi:hypothetical protein
MCQYQELTPCRSRTDPLPLTPCRSHPLPLPHTRIPKFDIYKSCNYKNREEFLDKLIAGCHSRTCWTFENKNTLVVSPTEKSSENIIGGNLSFAKAIGIRRKQTNKDLFLSVTADRATEGLLAGSILAARS